MSYITAFGIANPSCKVPQGQIAEFMGNVMTVDARNQRKLRSVFRSSGIQYRYSVLDDYAKTRDFTFFPNNEHFEPFPTTTKRMQSFREHALPLSTEAIKRALGDRFDCSDISHLITVCCTGMYAPGLDIEILNAFNLPLSTPRICLNFMGCYAAITALRTADALCSSDPSAKVLVVCTELCSLHFQKEFNDDNLLANALFADGSAAVIVESDTRQRVGLKPLKFQSQVLTEGDREMAWHIGDHGFEMKLSAYVPSLVGKGIRELVATCLRESGLHIEDISYFAIHPGGKRILEVAEKELNIPPARNQYSYDVLRNYGNMSSPTVLFVLREIFNVIRDENQGQYILSLAFGPGLTIEMMLLQVVIK
jgi:prepilin-type processing-associated H-X9-DG protein